MANSEVIKEKTFFGHPTGLFILFFTEMWERFSFYGMKALLLLYLIQYHMFSDTNGNLLVGSYAAMVYAVPVIGGYLADKYLGYRKAVTFGAILLVLGHLGMAYEGTAAYDESGSIIRDDFALQAFYFSLALIIMGVGFLKANISTIVGELYQVGDKRRDSGFTIFYMGINLGSVLATLICAYLGENYGWKYGFGLAGIGMLIGLITFLWGSKYFYGKAEPKKPEVLKEKVALGLNREIIIYLLSIAGTFLMWQIMQRHSVVEILLLVAGIASLIFIVYYAIKHLDKIGRDRLLALTVLIIFTVIFWALFEQAYTSLTLFAKRATELTFLGINFTAGQVLSFNGIFIIMFAPVFAWIWIKLSNVNKNPNTAVKFAFGLIFVGCGFGLLMLGENLSDGAKVALMWLVLCYMLHTFGELCLSPVGLSAVTKLSPVKIVGFMMGVWFLATASSEYIAALLANIASLDESAGNSTDITVAKAAYYDLFKLLFYVGLASGIILLALSPILKRMMHGVDDESVSDEDESALMDEKH